VLCGSVGLVLGDALDDDVGNADGFMLGKALAPPGFDGGVASSVGPELGDPEGCWLGLELCELLGILEGRALGLADGTGVGAFVGAFEGALEGFLVGALVG
jgi:hypothetical protein